MISGVWLAVCGAIITASTWRVRDPRRAAEMVAANRRALGGRFGSNFANHDLWVASTVRVATASVAFGVFLMAVGAIWALFAAFFAII